MAPAEAASGGETEVLRAFVGHLLTEPTEGSWHDLFPREAEAGARAVYFLLHRDPAGGADASGFVGSTLERLLLQLQSRTEREMVEYRGRVRGQIVWPATLKRRHTASHDPTRFVCRRVHRHFDTPENQLLRFTVEAIRRSLDAVPEPIRSGFCYYPAGGGLATAPIRAHLEEIEAALQRLRAHPRLRSVSLPESITPEHLLRAETSKLEEYGLVAELHRRLHDALLAEGLDGVARLGRQSLPLPDRLSPATEPWIRLAARILQRAR